MSNASQTALAVELSTIDPTWRIALRVWSSWPWRTFLVSLLLAIFANFWIGALGGIVGMRYLGVVITRQAIGWLIGAVVGLYFFKDVLDGQFQQFRVCVVPRNPPERQLATSAS